MDAVNALQKSLWTPRSLKSEGLNKSSTTVCSTGRTCTLASATGASVSASATASRHRSGVLEGDVARRPGADIMTARVQERETEAAVSRCERGNTVVSAHVMKQQVPSSLDRVLARRKSLLFGRSFFPCPRMDAADWTRIRVHFHFRERVHLRSRRPIQ